MSTMPATPERSDPAAAVRILWRWKYLFVAVLVAAPLVAFLVVRGKPKVYQSSALVSVNSANVNTPGGGGGGGGSFTTTNLFAIARLVSTTPVARVAAQLLHPPGNPGALAGAVSAVGDQDTGFITITAQGSSPQGAAAIANAFAQALGVDRTASAIGEINGQIAALQRQLQATPSTVVNGPTRSQIQQQITQLQSLRGAQNGNVTVLQPATPSATPVSPHVRRTVELGLVIGLLLAIGAVTLAENSDRRIRGPADLEDLTKLPLLSAVPSRAFAEAADTTDQVDEAFQMLRASLTYFNVDRRLSTVVITSPGERDGKTTVAVRLAVAAARTGKRVILVDADLRRSQAGARLGLAADSGLGAVLAGERQLADALLEYPVTENQRSGRLLLLPAGAPPPNPSELISSNEMSRLLGQLEDQADLVIIDTPPALAVSDTMALLPQASGIVLVARIDQNTRETVRRAQRLITSARGTLLGVVATGAHQGPGYDSYAYGYYGADAKRRRWPFGRRGRRPLPLDSGDGASSARIAADSPELNHSEPAHQP